MAAYKEVGESLCKTAQKLIPSVGKTPHGKKPAQQPDLILQKLYDEARSLRAEYTLGFIGRALALWHFQKSMLAAGYDSSLVHHLVFAILTHVFIGQNTK
jgi:hypothetical protein